MRKLSLVDVILSHVGSNVLGMDKESYNKRIKAVKQYNVEQLIIKANSIDDAGDRAMAFQAIDVLEQAINGYVHSPILMDWCSSGASLISVICRDLTGMKSCGVFNEFDQDPGNLYQVTADLINKLAGSNYLRKQVKKAMLSYYYGGQKKAKLTFGEDLKFFEQAYAQLLPCAYEFRKQTLNAWPSELNAIEFTLPDHYQVYVPILLDSASQRLDIVDDDITNGINMHFKVQGCRRKGAAHTLGLGAHLIHGCDGFIKRELIVMSRLTREMCLEILARDSNMFLDSGNIVIPECIQGVLESYKETGYLSYRVFALLKDYEGEFHLPVDLRIDLLNMAERLGDETFEMLHIHDEFGVLPQYVNQLRKNANTVYAGLYRSNLMEYYNRKFNMSVPVKPFDKNVYEQLLEVDYLLS